MATQYYIDPSGGSDAGSGTIGSPWKTVQYALNTITQNATSGDTLNIKSGGTDTISTGLVLTTYGTPTTNATLTFRGYASTANDGGVGVIDLNASCSLLDSTTISYVNVIDMEIRNSGANVLIRGSNVWSVYRCNLHGTTNAHMIQLGTGSTVNACWIWDHVTATPNYTINAAISGTKVLNNFIDSTTDHSAVYLNQGSCVVENNIIRVNSTNANARGITLNASSQLIRNNSVFSSVAATGYGIFSSAVGAYGSSIINNIVEGFSGAGGVGLYLSNSGLNSVIVMSNRFWNNTTSYTIAGSPTIDTDNTDLGASCFTSPAGNDFTVSTAVKAAGHPNYIGGPLITTSPTYIDIGATQRQEAGGGIPIARGMHGGMR